MGAVFASANQATAENPKIEAVHSANERTQQNREDVLEAASASANQAMAENPKIEAVHSANERTQQHNREDVVAAASASANQAMAENPKLKLSIQSMKEHNTKTGRT